jgi:hypothetical protein
VEEETKQPWDAGIHAMRQSLNLAREGHPRKLSVLDDSIAEANEEKRGMW